MGIVHNSQSQNNYNSYIEYVLLSTYIKKNNEGNKEKGLSKEFRIKWGEGKRKH